MGLEFENNDVLMACSLDNVKEAARGCLVSSGCEVTARSPAAMAVDISRGRVKFGSHSVFVGDGFESGSLTTYSWTKNEAAPGDITVQGTTVKSGNYAVKMTESGSGVSSAYVSIDTRKVSSSGFIRTDDINAGAQIAFYLSGYDGNNAATKLCFKLGIDNSGYFYNNGTEYFSGSPASDTWYYWTAEWNNSTEEVTVKFYDDEGGSQQASFTYTGFDNSGSVAVAEMGHYQPTGTASVFFDDFDVLNPISINSADSTNDRYDIISVDEDGIVNYSAGTASANPYPPNLPTDEILLAVIFVEHGTTTIETADISDERIIEVG